MRNALKMICALAVLAICSGGSAYASSICPTTGNTNSDCGFVITIGTSGVTGTAVPGANPYDGNDDALVGIVNNTGKIYSGPIHLAGSGNGGGLFAFDGDGICSFTGAAYCSTPAAPTGYEGPDVMFANYVADPSKGDVVISNLGIGGTTYFSLESSPSSIAGGGGIGLPVGQTPEPGSILLLGTGALGVAARLRHRFLKS